MTDDQDAVALPFSIRTAALTVIVVIASVLALKAAAPIAVPILISILLAYALEPLVSALMSLRLPRGIAAVIVFGLALACVRAGASSVASRASAFAADLPATVAAIRAEIASHQSSSPTALDAVRRAGAELEQAAARAGTPSGAKRVAVVKPPFEIGTLLVDNGTTLAGAAVRTLIVALLTFLLMTTGDLLKQKLLRLGGSSLESRRITAEVIKNIDRQIERYLVVRILISAIVATLTALALWPLGLNHWLAWGIVAGVLNLLPFIGPTVAVAAIALAAFLQFREAGPVITATGLSGLVAMLEGNFITPWLTSRAGELNTVAVFVGVLFWGWMWGIWGLVLAVPILVTIKAAADHIEAFRPIGELLGR